MRSLSIMINPAAVAVVCNGRVPAMEADRESRYR